MKRIAPVLCVSLMLCVLSLVSFAQTDNVEAMKAEGQKLIETQKYLDSLPIYEKLSKLAPKDPDVFRNLGFALLALAANARDEAAARQARIRARDSFILARDLVTRP